MKLILNLSTTILMSMLLGIALAPYLDLGITALYVIPIVLALRVVTIVKY